jgi:hypothetical protein
MSSSIKKNGEGFIAGKIHLDRNLMTGKSCPFLVNQQHKSAIEF